MDIVVRLRQAEAEALRRDPRGSGASQAASVVARHGLELAAQHPDTPDPALRQYFVVTGVPAGEIDGLVAALLRTDGVEAAYPQPPVSPA